jgi:hypothetical protein
MYIPEEPQDPKGDTIVIAGRSDVDFWCQRLSISPFTLFHLLRSVGNNVSQIGEFLHSDHRTVLDNVGEPIKDIGICKL